jgi:opacity protein-like surface antigen
MVWHVARVVGFVLVGMAVFPALSAAQGIGVGPRMSFVRGDQPADDDSTRFFGGILRLGLSRRLALEGALDFKTTESADGLSRIKERPLQASMLLFPVRSTLAPYILLGYGWYSRTVESLDSTGAEAEDLSSRRTGAHIGAGAELMLGRHAAITLDYRYRFVSFGSPVDGESAVNLPIIGSRLSHRGSMWASGLVLYF